MTYRIASLIVLIGGTLALTAATADAHPMIRPMPVNPGFMPVAMPGSNPRTWSPYPLNNRVMPGSDPRTWSPYPLNPNVMPGSDPRTWSPYPLYPTWRHVDNGPIPYWLQNPYWRQSMPASNVVPYGPYTNPYAGGFDPFLNPYLMPFGNPYFGNNLPLNGYNLYE